MNRCLKFDTNLKKTVFEIVLHFQRWISAEIKRGEKQIKWKIKVLFMVLYSKLDFNDFDYDDSIFITELIHNFFTTL